MKPMLIKSPEFISDQRNKQNWVSLVTLPAQKGFPFSKERTASFVSENEKTSIIRALHQGVDFLNENYANKNTSLIPLDIITIPGLAHKGHQNVTAVYAPYSTYGVSGIIVMDTDFLTHKNNWKNAQYPLFLKKAMGLPNFTKLVLFHEAGHCLDYLCRNQLLQSEKNNKNNTQQKDIDWQNFLGAEVVAQYGHFWQDNTGQNLTSKFKEHVADCWSCVLLAQMPEGLSLKKSVKFLKEARSLEHGKDEEDLYATHHSLDRLLLNSQSLPHKTAQDMFVLVNLSAQQGFSQSLLSLMKDKKKQEIQRKILSDFGVGPETMANKLQDTVKKFKL